MDAAIAAGEYQARNIRSMKCIIDQEPVLRISGIAIRRASAYPPGADQRKINLFMKTSDQKTDRRAVVKVRTTIILLQIFYNLRTVRRPCVFLKGFYCILNDMN